MDAISAPALQGGDYQQRFGGIARVYGAEALALFRRLHVCVVGVGGVGSWAVEALARSGVGRLTLIDDDTVCLTNANRQLHTLTETLDRPKVEVMAERVRGINPQCVVEAIDDYLTMETMAEYLERGYDYVIDAIDSIKFKAAMIAYCRRRKTPIVTTGGAGGLTDPTQIKVADLSKTYNDPLAAKLRRRLRRDYGFPANPKRSFGVECVFSSQQPVYPRADGSVCHDKPGIHGVSLDCRYGYGSASVVTAGFGLTAASRVLSKSVERKAKTKA